MSKRLQVLVPDKDLVRLRTAAKKRGVTMSDLVRDSIVTFLAQVRPRASQDRIASVMRFARFEGPTGDIEQILSEIESGRK